MRRFFPSTIRQAGGGGSAPYSIALSFGRRIDPAYTGPHLIIERMSDNVQQEFGFNGSDELDHVAIASFLGSNVGEVVRLYNQGYDTNIPYFENNVDSDRPVIYNGTNFFIENGRYYADFSPLNAFLAAPRLGANSIMDKDSFSVCVFKTQSIGTSIQILFTDVEESPNNENAIRQWSDMRNNRVQLQYQPTAIPVNLLLSARAVINTLRQYSYTRNLNEMKTYWNKVLQSTVLNSNVFPANNGYFVLGRQTFEFQSNNFQFTGLFAELIIDANFDEVKRDTIETDQLTYYGI